MNTCLGRVKISKETKYAILYYYKELYENFEMKSTVEIGEELGITDETVRKFLSTMILEPDSHGKFSDIATMILLCTRFGSTSPYTQYQKLLDKEIAHRRLVRQVKDGAYELNKRKKSGK